MKKTGWFIFILFAFIIGCYPLAYVLVDMSQGLLGSKPVEVLDNAFWKVGFYQHIMAGGIALITGCSQFSIRWRTKYLTVHRTLEKIYLLAVLMSGTIGLYISFYATGGIIASMGFGSLAVAWLFTTLRAYRAIRKKETDRHEKWMIRSYALTFAAGTLRIWLPSFQLFWV